MDFSQLITALIAIVIGAGILVYAGMNIRRGSERKSWSQTTGEIISAKVEEVVTHGDYTSTDYFPKIYYRYKVNLVEYESGSVNASEAPFTIGKQKFAALRVEKFKPNSKVIVYYNPDNPNEAVLENTGASPSGMILLFIVGIPVFLCGLVLLIGFLVQAGMFGGIE